MAVASVSRPRRALHGSEVDLALAEHCSAPVLIVGESQVVCRELAGRIHQAGVRRFGSWVAIGDPHRLSAAGLAAALAQANGGTVFLGNADRLSGWQQRRLLRWFEQSLARDGGGPSTRLIVGASPALFNRVGSHRFSERLFYRINTIRIDATGRHRRGVARQDDEADADPVFATTRRTLMERLEKPGLLSYVELVLLAAGAALVVALVYLGIREPRVDAEGVMWVGGTIWGLLLLAIACVYMFTARTMND